MNVEIINLATGRLKTCSCMEYRQVKLEICPSQGHSELAVGHASPTLLL